MKSIYKLTAILIISFILNGDIYSQCIDNTHSPFSGQSWLSCEETASPVLGREEAHWILYDLKYDYSIDSIIIWNYNEWSKTGNGVKDIIIDYSDDKIDWKSLGSFQINKAPGSWKYNTPDTLELNINSTRYLLISVIESWDNLSTCSGFGEIKMNVSYLNDVDDILTEVSIDVFPNPAYEEINIKVSIDLIGSKMMIINNLGQIVNSFGFIRENEFSVPINDLNAGFYLIHIENEYGTISKSFVKASY